MVRAAETGQMVAGRLAAIEERIDAACRRSGRSREAVTLIGVSKTFSAESVREVVEAGVRILGENRVQEAEEKMTLLSDLLVEWHLIGHLQSNKARRAVEIFDMIHSVDSLKLAERIDTNCREAGKRMPVLLEVNLGGEETKAGVAAAEVPALCQRIARLPNIELQGLMTVPPFLDDLEAVRPFFRRLRELRDEVRRLGIVGPDFSHLSMGMSHDFETAIEEGATFVRIGTALFGKRGVG